MPEKGLAMKYQFSDLSQSDVLLIAKKEQTNLAKTYHFKHLDFLNLVIPDRYLAWEIEYQPEDSMKKAALRKAVDEYNQYLQALEAIPGFLDEFIVRGKCISREFVEKHWSAATAETVFSLKPFCFETDLLIIDGFLFDKSISCRYQVEIEGNVSSIPVGSPWDQYPETIGKCIAIWNWADNGHDFCYDLWWLESGRYLIEPDDDETYYAFNDYEQIRDEEPEPQLVRIFKKIERSGYLRTYTIRPESYDPMWVYYGKSDGSMDIALIDPSFSDNHLLTLQTNLLFWAPVEKSRYYFLTDRKEAQYLSERPGTLGGHDGLKIYGKLNCPSALKHIEKAKEKYIRHRVFFENEETAVEAGYRPCAVRMPEEYRKWKSLTDGTHQK